VVDAIHEREHEQKDAERARRSARAHGKHHAGETQDE